MEPRVRYAKTSDGVDIAYATTGEGPPLLVARGLLERPVDDEPRERDSDSHSPDWRRLSERHTLIFWDWRGLGLSSSTAPDFSMETAILDMAAVADAVAAQQFDVLGAFRTAHVAVAYTARHPGRVGCLVLLNPPIPGTSPMTVPFADVPDIVETNFRAYIELVALRLFGWERAPAAKSFVDTMLGQFDSETWVRSMHSMDRIDATDLAPLVSVPVLVVIDLDDAPRLNNKSQRQYMGKLAALFPNSELRVRRRGEPGDWTTVVDAFLGSDKVPATASGGPAAGTAIILFADVVDSTATQGRLGNAAFRERTRQLEDALRAVIRTAGGTPVEGRTLGDGVIGVFTSAAQAIDAALHCGEQGERVGLQLHLGIHAGDVIHEAGNVSGVAVSLASRISDLTGPNEILVSSTVRDLARASTDVTFDDRGEYELKGVGEPVRLYAVRTDTTPTT